MENWDPAFPVNHVSVFPTVGPWWTFDFCFSGVCTMCSSAWTAKSWIESIQRVEYVKQGATTDASDHGSVWLQCTCCATFWHLNNTHCSGGAVITCIYLLPLAAVLWEELIEPEKEKWTQMFWRRFMLSMKACFHCIAGSTWWDEGRSLTPPPIVHSELTSILFPVLRTHQSMMPRVELPQG